MKIRLKGKFETRQVWADDKELHPRQSFKLRVHSPDGFSWGYCGSGPAQLAMAVLLKYYTKVCMAKLSIFQRTSYCGLTAFRF